jgi:ADP-heptose:LPS heptosyltransferase
MRLIRKVRDSLTFSGNPQTKRLPKNNKSYFVQAKHFGNRTVKSILMPQRIDALKTLARVRAAQLFRAVRDYYPGAGLPLTACLSLIRRRHREDALLTGAPPRSVLVIRLDAMGDLIMATPIFRELKQAYPGASITALVPKANLEILETNPFVDRIITLLPIRRFRLLQRVRRDLSIVRLYWKFLRGEHFDLALQPRLGPDYFGANLLLTLVSASFRMKYEDDLKSGPSKLLAKVAYRSVIQLPRPVLQHEVLSNRAFIQRLTGQTLDCSPEVFLSNTDGSYSKRFYEEAKTASTMVCVAFGAQAKRRQWPLKRWVETLCLLAKSRDIAVVILCSRAERGQGERLRSMLDSNPGIESWIVSGAGLRQVAGCMQACDLLLGADSGAAHLAAAVGCAVLVLSPHPLHGDPHHENSPLRFRPYSGQARVLQPEIGRYPCRSGCDAVEPHCLLNLTPSQVAEVAEEMLLAGRAASRFALQDQDAAQRVCSSSPRAPDTSFPYVPIKARVPVNFPAALQQNQASE